MRGPGELLMAWQSSGGYPGVAFDSPDTLYIAGSLIAVGKNNVSGVGALATGGDGSAVLANDTAKFEPDGSGFLADNKLAWSPDGGFGMWNKNTPATQPTVSQALVTAVADANTKAALQALLDALNTSTIIAKVT